MEGIEELMLSLSLPPSSLSLSFTHTHARARARTHIHTHTHTSHAFKRDYLFYLLDLFIILVTVTHNPLLHC